MCPSHYLSSSHSNSHSPHQDLFIDYDELCCHMNLISDDILAHIISFLGFGIQARDFSTSLWNEHHQRCIMTGDFDSSKKFYSNSRRKACLQSQELIDSTLDEMRNVSLSCKRFNLILSDFFHIGYVLGMFPLEGGYDHDDPTCCQRGGFRYRGFNLYKLICDHKISVGSISPERLYMLDANLFINLLRECDVSRVRSLDMSQMPQLFEQEFNQAVGLRRERSLIEVAWMHKYRDYSSMLSRSTMSNDLGCPHLYREKLTIKDCYDAVGENCISLESLTLRSGDFDFSHSKIVKLPTIKLVTIIVDSNSEEFITQIPKYINLFPNIIDFGLFLPTPENEFDRNFMVNLKSEKLKKITIVGGNMQCIMFGSDFHCPGLRSIRCLGFKYTVVGSLSSGAIMSPIKSTARKLSIPGIRPSCRVEIEEVGKDNAGEDFL
mmetsp:Transcript_2526/g.5431  ORF Transcript_2526/g.5431 Transcript_2526/m.5431 type:complete len:435 (-) Transcript_2526:5-1309(-)